MKKNINIIKYFFVIVMVLLAFLVGQNQWKVYKKSVIVKRKTELLAEAEKIPPESFEIKYKDIPYKDKYKVVFLSSAFGESSYAEYFKYTAERNGWNVKVYHNEVSGGDLNEILEFDPDMILAFIYSAYPGSSKLSAHRSRKYLISFMSFPSEDTYIPFHGVLSARKDIGFFKLTFDNLHKPFEGFRLFPAMPALNLEPAEPKYLMWSGSQWDKLRSSPKYKNFLNSLATITPMKFYGPYTAYWDAPNNSYDGFISPGMDNIAAIRENGMYLLGHTTWHFETNVPSIKFFEAASSNVVIISDKLPFIMEKFGDDILYFDHDAEVDVMCEQIKKHVDWIKANPEKAKAMADRVHKKILANYTLDQDLIKIAKMHEYILQKEKAMGLSRSLGY